MLPQALNIWVISLLLPLVYCSRRSWHEMLFIMYYDFPAYEERGETKIDHL